MENIKYSNKELLIQYKIHNDLEARNKLIINNIGLVHNAAKKRFYSNSSFTMEDLIQEGIIGMMKGIERFDINKSTAFSTYVYYWISQQMDRSLMNNGYLIRLPAYICEKINKMNAIENKYKFYEQNVDMEILRKQMKISKKEFKKIDYYRKSHYYLLSLNVLVHIDNDDPYTELQDFIPSEQPSLENIIIYNSLKEDIEKALNILSSREAEILKMRYGLIDGKPQTLEEIGNKFDVTRERIRQIESKALKKIRNSNNHNLKEYLSYR